MTDADKHIINEILNEHNLIEGTLIKGADLIKWTDTPSGIMDVEDTFSSVGETPFGTFFINKIAPHPANPKWIYALSFTSNQKVKSMTFYAIICANLDVGQYDNSWAREDAKQIAMGWLLAQLRLVGVSL